MANWEVLKTRVQKNIFYYNKEREISCPILVYDISVLFKQ